MAAPTPDPVIAASEIGVSTHALGPELVKQALGDLVDAAGARDVLADDDHPLVARHLLAQAPR